MIRFVATDMDGTLLNDKKTMNQEIFPLIHALKKKNITFAAASGRQLNSLRRLFGPVEEDMMFIAENGAFVYYKGRELYSEPMDPALVQELLKAVQNVKDALFVLCGKYCAYTDKDEVVTMMQSEAFQYNIKKVPDLSKVQDEILKFSICDLHDAKTNSLKIMAPLFQGKAAITLSGFNCLDFMSLKANKGHAIKMIQNKLPAKFEETVVFGDNYNDVEMLENAYYSFAMKNAEEGVKKSARFLAESNNDDGVIQKIKELCF